MKREKNWLHKEYERGLWKMFKELTHTYKYIPYWEQWKRFHLTSNVGEYHSATRLITYYNYDLYLSQSDASFNFWNFIPCFHYSSVFCQLEIFSQWNYYLYFPFPLIIQTYRKDQLRVEDEQYL